MLTLFVGMIVMENPKIARFRIKSKWSAKEEIREPKLDYVLYNCRNMSFWRYLSNVSDLYLPNTSCSYLWKCFL